MYKYSVLKEKNVANVSTDRVFNLVAIDPDGYIQTSRKRTTFNLGMFQGEKKLHAIQETGLWKLAYRNEGGMQGGNLPEPLKQRWTNFNQLMKFLVPYFENRGVRVEEIIA